MHHNVHTIIMHILESIFKRMTEKIQTKIIKKRNTVASKKIGDEYMIAPTASNMKSVQYIYTLKDVSAFIWERIDGKNSFQEIVNMIAQEYEIEKHEAAEDFEELLSEMSDLIELV